MPVLPHGTIITAVDRAKGPLNPAAPDYIQQGLTWEQMDSLLKEHGI